MFHRMREFVDSVVAEFKKVQWPTRDNTLKSTSTVVVISLILALFLGVADFGLSELMKVIISY